MSIPVSSLPFTSKEGVNYDIRMGIETEGDKTHWSSHVYLGGVEVFVTKTKHRTEEDAHFEGLEWARAHSRKK